MAKTDMDKYGKYIGYKFFRLDEEKNEVKIIRVIGLEPFNDKFRVKSEEDDKIKILTYGELSKYTPLQPNGFIMITDAWANDRSGNKYDDIIITLYDYNHIKILGDKAPYAVCRQSINDIFYNVIRTDPNLEVVGCCVSKETIPPNLQISDFLACSGVYEYQMVNYYIEDTVESVLECVDVDKPNNILLNLFKAHMEAKNTNNPLFDFDLCNDRQNDGWCRNIATLLHENNFATDFDTLRSIQALDFELDPYIIKGDGTDIPDELDEEIVAFLSRTYKIPIEKVYIMTYGHDIDLADFAEQPYMLFRDSKDITYLALYINTGKYLSSELEEKYNQISPSDKIRLAFYNKYQGLSGDINPADKFSFPKN